MRRKILTGVAGLFLMSLSIFAQPVFTVTSATATQGEMVEINILVDDYTDYISLQFSVNWDPEVLSYQGVTNLTEDLPGFSEASSINLPSPGNLSVSWFEMSLNPITLDNGTNVFTIQFEVVGGPCSDVIISDEPTEIEIADENEMNVGASVNNGQVALEGEECGPGTPVRFIGSMETGANGSQVCVQFTTENFVDIASAQFSINFNPAVIAFSSVENINWPGVTVGGNFSTENAGNGVITFVWVESTTEGISIDDGTVLFELCFNVVGSGGQMSPVAITESPLDIEIGDPDAMLLDYEIVDGKVTVEGTVEGFALISEDAIAAPGSEVCVDIQVQDFTDIISLQFSVNWDSTVLMYDHAEGFGLPVFDENNVIGPEAPGNTAAQATVVWIDQALEGVTLPDGSTIFTMCFNVVGGCDDASTVSFSGDPLEIEVSDVNDVLEVSQIAGTVSVSCEGCGADIVSAIPPCPGEMNGSIDITVFGCVTPITYAWSNGESTEDITGLAAGDYVVTITTNDNQIIIPDTVTLIAPDPITVNANITDATEGGDGAVSITVSGGTEPYTFQWDDPAMSTTQNISGLDPGAYSVTVTDANGCTFTAGPFMVREGGAIAAEVTHVACFGESTGSIDLTVNDCGEAPFTFVWSNDATSEDLVDIPGGEYSVTVTSSDGMTCETSFTVTEPASALEVSVDVTDDTGGTGDGAIDLTVSGGETPYAFSWADGPSSEDRTGLSAGSYAVTITDGRGCQIEETILVRGDALFVNIAITEYNDFGVSCFSECDGELIAMTGNGIGSLTFAWSNGATTQSNDELCAGSYSVTVTDETGQEAVATAEVIEPGQLQISVDVQCASEPGATDGSAVATVSGGVAPYSYEWSTGGSTSSIQNQTPGPAVVFVADANNCEVMQQLDICIEGIDCYEAIDVITPNGDGKNDRFVVQCVFDLPNTLSVYNRYGGLEFEMDNYDNSWEGTDQAGNLLSDGGYHWVLQVFLNNGDRRIYKGTVALIRSLD